MEGNRLDSTLVLNSRPVLTERFDLISVLGQGGASTVYRVRDRYKGNKEVALKLLVDEQAFDEHTLQRFKNEFSLCKKIRHHNIVKAYELINLKDGIAFTMEYVQGQDLATLFSQKRFTMLEIDKMLLQLLNAVEELHNNNVVHRDIKLENILIRDDGVLKLGDLGLMKADAIDTMTKSGIIVGTAQYMPPEYITDSQYDNRGDIYGIGIVLHELLCGERRLADKSGQRAIKHLLKTDFEIPKIHLAAVPPKYHKMIKKALDPNPDRRFQSITEMKEVLKETQSREAIPGTVEMVGNIRIDECLKRRIDDDNGSSPAKNRRPRDRIFSRRSLKILAVSAPMLFVFIVTYEVVRSWLLPINLPLGSYDGVLTALADEQPVRIRFVLGTDSVWFLSDIEYCSRIQVDTSSGEIPCPDRQLMVKIRNYNDEGLYGEIFDTRLNARRHFRLQRTILEDGYFRWTLPRW